MQGYFFIGKIIAQLLRSPAELCELVARPRKAYNCVCWYFSAVVAQRPERDVRHTLLQCFKVVVRVRSAAYMRNLSAIFVGYKVQKVGVRPALVRGGKRALVGYAHAPVLAEGRKSQKLKLLSAFGKLQAVQPLQMFACIVFPAVICRNYLCRRMAEKYLFVTE